MKVGDLVTRSPYAGFYQVVAMYRNEYGGRRCDIMCLVTGKRVHELRTSQLRVARYESR